MERLTFTADEISTLKEADIPLQRWHRSHYVSGCSMAMAERLIAIYKRHTGSTQRLKSGCGQCVMEVFQYLAPRYMREVVNAENNGAKKNKRRKAQEQ